MLRLSLLAAGSALFGLTFGLAACNPAAEASPGEAAPLASASTIAGDRLPRPSDELASGSRVVVELFTSEGCSSCPPADRLLARLDADDARVIALAYHVDYWDRLGWTDPFGDAAYSARQRAYARTLDGRVYTPQMVVGGTDGFVGSNATRAAAALRDASAPTVRVELAARAEGRTVTIEHAAVEATPGAVLHLALVQRATHTDVPRGENQGRRLEHVRVVRQLVSTDGTPGITALTLPDELAADDVRVVGFVQEGPVGRILGAAEVGVTG